MSTTTNAAVDSPCYEMDGFVLRTPLLPVAAFLGLTAAGGGVAHESPEAYSAATGRVREGLRELVTQPDIAEAIFIASPALSASTPQWLASPSSKGGQKTERSLMKYLARMSTRCTPFGLFSGCSPGRFAAVTQLVIQTRFRVQRHSRLDMDYLFALTEAYNQSPLCRAGLRFRPNDTLVALAGRYRYVEARVGSGNVRSYHLVAVEQSPYLDIALRASAGGATMQAIAAALLEFDSELEPAEVTDYLDELINSHVLVSTFQPAVTGREPAEVIAEELRGLGAAEAADRLDSVIATLRRIDNLGTGRSPEEYALIVEALKPLRVPVQVSRLVQVDMRRPAVATLGPSVRAEIQRCAETLARFGRITDVLGSFKTAFERRYGSAVMPLLQVLDDESGIGLGDVTATDESPILAGFPVVQRREQNDELGNWRPRHTWLLDRLQALWADGSAELVLTDDDLPLLYGAPAASHCPSAFAVGVTLVAQSTEAVDRGDFSYVFHTANGPSGAKILGRFCHVDPEIGALVAAHVHKEEAADSDAVFAEVVHLPQGRIGNIMLRPVLRDYELTLLGRSGAPADRQITLGELSVTVRAGRIILWCERLGKRVIPRLTNAHNFGMPGTLTPYRFIASLQMDGLRSVFMWDWGPLGSVASLPRVRWGRCILVPAVWRVTADELQPLVRLRAYPRYVAVRAWAAKRRLPRLVALTDGDNELLVDFDNPLSVDAFIELVDNRPRIQLSEMYPTPDALCVSDSAEGYSHEIYIPVTRVERPTAAQVRSPSGDVARAASLRVGRHAPPGSNWLFVKLYAGAAEVDRILTTVVAPIVAGCHPAGVCDRWFFVRYADPDHHLRLRFRGNPTALNGDLLVQLNSALAPLVANGNISRVQVDTYQPEFERYGGVAGLELSEELFEADSEAVLALVSELEGDGGEARWHLGLRGVETLIDDFDFDPLEKREFIAKRRRDYGLEFNVDATSARHLLSERFRQHRTKLEALDDVASKYAQELVVGLNIWNRRSARIRSIACRLRALETAGDLLVPVRTLVESYVHMFVNRLTRANTRMHELLVFDFLNRKLESHQARARRSLLSYSARSDGNESG